MKRNSKICLFALVMLLSTYNGVMAQDTDIYSTLKQDEAEKVKVNKDTLVKAQEAIDSKDFNSAINYLNNYLLSKPKKYEAYKMRGDAYYAIRRYDLAQKDYQAAIDIKSSNDKLMTNTKYVSAILLGADKNEQLQNTDLGNLYGALMYAQKAQNDPAYATSYENAIKYNSHIYLPQPNKTDINKINCPQKYGKTIPAKGIDEKINGAINDIEKQNYNEALYKLATVTGQYPAYYMGYYLTGVALAGLEKDDEAIKAFEKSVMLNPYDFESYASLGQIYYSKAETTFNNEYTKKSVEYFNKALTLNKNCPTYYFYLGMNELQNGNTNSAINNFDRAIRINPNDYNSQYYKLIAQYIKGDYQSVANGATQLLYKHVSNYNSVLYLRALAYSKLNDNEKALADLNSIENNIEDIYNQDIKTITPKDKSLESYIHYLKAQIEHKQGLGASSDVGKAYTNPIVNRLAYAQKAMEPYQKSLEGDTVTLSDYKKFENFYSTALPKLLASGAIINYDDIDNQYDYIRTTFDDLGISFVYTNPDYKMTTIKDYPYNKYGSKLPKEALQPLSANNEIKTAPVTNMRQQTPQTEMLIQNGETSLAQMLASNVLENRAKSEPFDPTKQKPSVNSAETIKIRDDIQKAEFKPETPPAEKVNTSSNIASGETHLTKEPLIDKANSQKVQNILDEEKNMQSKGMVFKAEQTKQTPDIVIKKPEEPKAVTPAPKTEDTTEQDGTVKITAKEIKQTPDIVIKHDKQIIAEPKEEKTQAAAQQEQTAKATDETKSDENEPIKVTAKEIKQTKDVKITYPPAQNATKAVETITSPYTKTATAEAIATADITKDAKQTAKTVAAKTDKSIAAAIAAADTATIAKPEVKTIAKSTKTDSTIAKTIAAKENADNIVEKHANITPADFGIEPKKHLNIEDFDDVVELDSGNITKKFGYDSDLFVPDRMGFAVNSTQPNAQVKAETPAIRTQEPAQAPKTEEPITPPVTIEEKPIQQPTTEVKQETPVIRTQEQAPTPKAEEPAVTVAQTQEQPKVEVKETTPAVAEEKPTQQTESTVEQPKAENITEQTPVQNEQPQTAETKPEETTPVVVVPEITVPETESPDKTVIREKLAEFLDENLPKQENLTEEAIIAEATADANEKAQSAINTAEQLKAERLKLKEEAKLKKEQLKAEANAKKDQLKAEKLKAKEEAKLLKAQAKQEADEQKALLKQEALAKKEQLKAERLKLKEEAKLKKEQEKLALAQMQENAGGAKHVIKQTVKNKQEVITEEIEQTEKQAQEQTAELKAKIEKEQIAQQQKLEKQQAKEAAKLAKEQAKAEAQTDELKVQMLQAKEEAKAAKETTKAEKEAMKKQLKEERAKARQEYKEKQAEKKALQTAQKAQEKLERKNQKAEENAMKLVKRAQKQEQNTSEKKKFSFKNMFKKMKFWGKKDTNN